MVKMMVLIFSEYEKSKIDKIWEYLKTENNVEQIYSLTDSIKYFKTLEIDVKKRKVYKNGIEISLSHLEFLTLQFLSEHPKWVFTKKQIFEFVYGKSEAENINNTVYCLIHSLRKKIEKDPCHPQYIQTVKGVGYKFVDPEE